MILDKTISLIIPCKNEEAALYSMLREVPKYVDEVLVIDNGSTDNTPIVAENYGAKLIREERNVEGVGYGYAHQSGMKFATGDIIVAMDGDGTYPLEMIQDVVLYMIKSQSDFVSCARFPLDNPGAISATRQFGVHILNMTVALLYGYHIKDILSGMWVLTRVCARKLNVSNGEWNFSPEIKLSAICNPDIFFSEFHISHDIRLNGLSKQNIWKTGLNHLLYIVQRRFTTDKISTKMHLQLFSKGFQTAVQHVYTFVGTK